MKNIIIFFLLFLEKEVMTFHVNRPDDSHELSHLIFH